MTQQDTLYPNEANHSDAPSLTDYVRAVVNILEDFGDEKQRLETTQKAVLNILEDLEDEKQSAQEANRMKSEFLANMSHELRTPLNSIIGFSELMSDGKVGPIADNHKEYLGDILTSARHLLQLINDVLDLAKVEAGKLEFDAKPIDVHQLIFGIRDTLRSIAASRNIHVEVNVDKELTRVIGDSARLKQVLYNYLSNALKFTPEGGKVEVSTQIKDQEFFKISVKDTGEGIAKEHLSRLFVEFEQLDASIGKRHQGTGLGLALTKRIVEAQGGHVGVNSIVGEGSEFFAVLPITLRTETSEYHAESYDVSSTEKLMLKALVINNNPAESDYLNQQLRSYGYETISVSNGVQAIEKARQQRLDLIVLDLDLPGLNAQQMLSEVRSSHPNLNTQVVVMSAYADNLGLRLSVHEELTKPLQKDKLIAAIDRMAHVSAKAQHIMVVDDEANDLKLMQKHLTDMGFYALGYTSAEDALKDLAGFRPNAIILDLVMPGMGGIELLKQLEKHPAAANIPIIIWSEKDCNEKQRQDEFSFASAFMHKADGHQNLIDELKRLFARQLLSRKLTE